jgi:hypothetical protein
MTPNKNTPCKDCSERFPACSDKCPKDIRGEYGYKAWKADYQKLQAAEKEYKRRRREDWMHSEEKEAGKSQYARNKNRIKRGNIYGR